MGLIQNGRWVDQWYDTDSTGGKFERQESVFRGHISQGVSALGTPQATKNPQATSYPPESGRYHLYVSYACPWAHRALIFRALKGLSEHISVSVVDPLMLENGWEFSDGDSLSGLNYLYQLYLKADPTYQGRVTVPVLWDRVTETIVNNESGEVIRIFNSEFNALTGNNDDYYPEALRSEIDAVNERVYHDINNGVYKAGFATSQRIYEEEYDRVFAALDWLEEHLSSQDFLVGNRLTEADWRLWTTLIRFDPVYHGHFKLNRNKLSEYEHIPVYMQRLGEIPGVAETVHLDHIKQHYYGSHKTINPNGVIPKGPEGFNHPRRLRD